MKHLILFALLSSLLPLPSSLLSAVPLRWTVETSRVQPATFDEFAGSTYDLEATLQSYGRPLEVVGEPRLYWQTNGMASAWWSAPATVSGNVLRATWTPACDVGAKAYNCFIGITGTVYNAAFQLRLRPSPGAVPNALPLPQKVIDFATVTVLNPPWPTGSARPLPPYLHEIDFDDTYPEDAAWFYALPHDYSSCSAVRDGGFLYRNYDWRLDDAAEFVVRVTAADGRFASLGMASVGTNLTERIVTSGRWSRFYRCLPGRTVDGINERGVACEVNVVGGDPHDRWPTNGTIHCMGAVRWVLDHATDAGMAASNLVEHLYFPDGFSQNFHWMIADATSTYLVENGRCSNVTGRAVMTNFPLIPEKTYGAGWERYMLLKDSFANITNAWYTRAYSRDTEWVSEFHDPAEMEAAKSAWETYGKETLRGKGLWQTVHTSVYDIENRTLRVAVQESDDWYTFALNDKATKTDLVSKRDKTDLAVYEDAWTEGRLWLFRSRTYPYTWLDTSGRNYIRYMGADRWEFGSFYDGEFTADDSADGPEDATEIVFQNSGTTYRLKVGQTSNCLATTSDLAAKRDLDDLSYVTTMPGGWTPTEVDGHRYDIYYDGYSGWYVEKLTYYPEWGEWYYDDYEWVEGPEDAETLVAHKIWSDETITFTRQQIEVSDSLVLSSQIGNQAEVAARNYIQNNDIAKTKTLLRTGRPGEHGTGWGTLHYQLSSDRRWWSMIVPSITASWTSGGYVDTSGTYVTASTVYFPGSYYEYYRADPINNRDHTPVAKFVESAGTNGTARCGAAKWAVGITAGPGSSTTTVRFDNSADLDAMPFLVTADVDHADGFGTVVFEDRSSVIPISFDLQDYYVNHYVISNFRFDEGTATVSGQSVSVKCLYDVNVSRTPTVKANYTAWCTLNLGCSAESYITTNPDYGRVMTDATRSLYYDRGLKATWRIAVTNGCFFAEVVSTNNVTEGVN